MIKEYYRNKEDALEAIKNYMISKNNYDAVLYRKPDRDSKNEELIKDGVTSSFSLNACNIARYLYSQDIFFDSYKDHLNRYMSIAGLNCYISFCNPMPAYLSLYMMHKYFAPYIEGDKTLEQCFIDSGEAIAKYWPYDKKWPNLEYVNNIDQNRSNPINCFYSVYINICIDDKSKDFTKSLESAYPYRSSTCKGVFNFKLLPARIEEFDDIIRFIHKKL